LRAFLGLYKYYRKFVPGFSDVAALLELTKKGRRFNWSQECQDAFDDTKKRLTSASAPPFSALQLKATQISWTPMRLILQLAQFCHRSSMAMNSSLLLQEEIKPYISELCYML